MARSDIEHFEINPSLSGMAEVLPEIEYARPEGVPLHMTILTPWDVNPEARPARPLIVFVQGSAWTTPNRGYALPQLCRYAQAGYVVATVGHRSSIEGHPFPAYLQDVKCAIRFLRANAGKYGVDPDRVCVWGTSSGGNTALLVGLTGDDPRYETENFADQSDRVQLVVECFGPTDLFTIFDPEGAHNDAKGEAIYYGLLGKGSRDEVMRGMSPILEVKDGAAYPPFLLLHGSGDPVVPYEQGTGMLDRLLKAGADAHLVCVDGAPHEGSFWSGALHRRIFSFIQDRL